MWWWVVIDGICCVVVDDSHELIDETLQLQCLPKIVELLSSSDKDLQVKAGCFSCW